MVLLSANLTVVDPLTRKIDIPRTAIEPTKALNRETVPSLCLLFLDGRCRQGADCNQIHADPETVTKLRADASRQSTCCQFHNEVNKREFERFPQWKGKALLVEGVSIPLERCAFTIGLQRSMENQLPINNQVPMSSQFVCVLQAGGHCRYSDECKFVHVCDDIVKQQLTHCVRPSATELERRHKGMPPPPPYQPMMHQQPQPPQYIPFQPQQQQQQQQQPQFIYHNGMQMQLIPISPGSSTPQQPQQQQQQPQFMFQGGAQMPLQFVQFPPQQQQSASSFHGSTSTVASASQSANTVPSSGNNSASNCFPVGMVPPLDGDEKGNSTSSAPFQFVYLPQ